MSDCPSSNTPHTADILIVFPPCWGVDEPPPGPAFLSSYVSTHGLEADVLDANIIFYSEVRQGDRCLWEMRNKNFWRDENKLRQFLRRYSGIFEKIIKQILDHPAKCIGFSVAETRKFTTLEIIKRIRDEGDRRKIILGGPSFLTERSRGFFISRVGNAIDAMVVGEGELSRL